MRTVKVQPGQSYGKLTVISLSRKGPKGAYFLCRCGCGREKEFYAYNLSSGFSKTCGCGRKTQGDNLRKKLTVIEIGKKYGRLTPFEGPFAGKKGQGPAFKCRCECGGYKLAGSHFLLKESLPRSCGCAVREHIKRVHRVVSHPPGHAARKAVYQYNRYGAKQRNLEWDITEDQFLEISQKPCAYCNCGPSNLSREKGRNGSFSYNGMDRVDSSRGYTPENVVPCCKQCNYAKRKLPVKDFLSWIERVFKHNQAFYENQENRRAV